MTRSAVVLTVAIALTTLLGGWRLGRDYQRLVSAEDFATQLISRPLGVETVGFKPLQELPTLKQIEVRINGVNRKFVVGEIQRFDVSRYGVRQELVLNYDKVAVAEVVRARAQGH